MAANRGLGKGFGSLIPEDFDNSILMEKKDRVHKISVDEITPAKDQPRQNFNDQAIISLSESIKRHGILQPLVITPDKNGYKIIAGERRYRAAKKAGLKEVPALVRTTEELDRIEIGLVENVQRVDLSPLEQAVSIARLNEQFNIDLKDIAKRLGKAHTTVVNIVRLLQLPQNARRALDEEKISEGHARSILALKEMPTRQEELLRNIINLGWSVRRAEQFVNESKINKKPSKVIKNRTIENKNSLKLAERLKTKVTIKPKAKGGRIEISYKSEDEMKRILNDLTR